VNRRAFLAGSAGLGVALMTSVACGSRRPAAAVGVQDATALTEVFGDGMKLTAVAVHYDRDIDNAKLTSSSFTVADRTVTRIYANTSAAVTPTGRNGRYVIIELSTDDPAAALWVTPQGGSPNAENPSSASATPPSSATAPAGGPPAAGQAGPAPTIKQATAAINQGAAVAAVDGSSLPATTEPVTTSKVINAVVDDFEQLQFTDPATGTTLSYNLFTPRNYDPAKRYPLVLFMHDASVVGAAPTGPLVQGLGAVSWATPDDQTRHPCFVVAPQ
jgi:predicted peptidase